MHTLIPSRPSRINASCHGTNSPTLPLPRTIASRPANPRSHASNDSVAGKNPETPVWNPGSRTRASRHRHPPTKQSNHCSSPTQKPKKWWASVSEWFFPPSLPRRPSIAAKTLNSLRKIFDSPHTRTPPVRNRYRIRYGIRADGRLSVADNRYLHERGLRTTDEKYRPVDGSGRERWAHGILRPRGTGGGILVSDLLPPASRTGRHRVSPVPGINVTWRYRTGTENGAVRTACMHGREEARVWRREWLSWLPAWPTPGGPHPGSWSFIKE